MKKSKLLILICVFIIFFVTGHAVGFAWGQASSIGELLSLDHQIEEQNAILLVTIDDLTSPQPTLESAWLLLIFPNKPTITLIPIFPVSPKSNHSVGLSLAEEFGLTSKKTLTKAFVDTLRNADITWDYYLIVDETGWLDYATTVGADNSGSSWINGQTVNSSFTIMSQDPHIGLRRQAYFFQQFCLTLSSSAVPTHLATFINSTHSSTDIKSKTLITYLVSHQNNGGSITCKFPTMD